MPRSRSADPLLDLIGLFYGAAVEPHLWPEANRMVAKWIGANTSALLYYDGSQHQISKAFLHNVPEDVQKSYNEYYHRLDPFELLIDKVPILNYPFVSADQAYYANYSAGEFYNDCAKHAGIYDVVAVAIPLAERSVFFIAGHRPEGKEVFGNADCSRLAAIVPHAKRAMQLYQQLVDRL